MQGRVSFVIHRCHIDTDIITKQRSHSFNVTLGGCEVQRTTACRHRPGFGARRIGSAKSLYNVRMSASRGDVNGLVTATSIRRRRIGTVLQQSGNQLSVALPCRDV